MSGLGLGLGLGLGAHRKVGDPYGGALALEYDLTQITNPTTIALAIKADGNWFDAGQEASIDWGDGTTHTVVNATTGQSGYISHEYTAAGTYIVKVSGTMKAYQRASFDDLAGQNLLTHIRSFGKLGIKSFRYAFIRCTGLISVPKYLPKSISNMGYMFYSCSGAAFNPNVSAWDVSNVTTMNDMFCNCSGATFNPNVSNWDVSNVTNMSWMFTNCSGAAFRGGRGTAGTGVASWQLRQAGVNCVSFMAGAKIQPASYMDAILNAWANRHSLGLLPLNVTITFPTNQPYNGSVSGASLALLTKSTAEGGAGWTISTLIDTGE
jgi:hypothetical protein